MPEPQHRFPLAGSAWHVWRDCVLRTTGFPADGLDSLSDPECVAAADATLDRRADEAEFQRAYDAASARVGVRIDAIAADPLIREAIIWQNRSMVATLDALVETGAGRPGAKRNSRRRYRERQLTRYWQRYLSKTETIGFFGPSAWGRVTSEAAETTAVSGADLLRRRGVFFEPWALVTVGATLAEDPAVRRWLPLCRHPHYVLVGNAVLRPGLPVAGLTHDEAAVVAAADGDTPAIEVAAALVADPERTPNDIDKAFELIELVVRRRLVRWDANIPLNPRTSDVLHRRVRAIGDAGLRTQAAAVLARLDAAKDRVAVSAADADSLMCALDDLDEVFTDVTGTLAQRRSGETYAGRTICFEDTTRDLELTIGSRMLDDLGPALEIVLDVARWLTQEVAVVYSHYLAECYDDLATQQQHVSLDDLWSRVLPAFLDPDLRPISGIIDELDRRWSHLFGLDPARSQSSPIQFTASALADRARELFGGARPGWRMARVHSPDLDICAASVDAINSGDYLAVLGEMHVAFATMGVRSLTWGLPDPDAPARLAAADYGTPRFMPLLPTAWPGNAGRAVFVEYVDGDIRLGFGKAPAEDLAAVLPVAAVSLSLCDGELVGTLPDGQSLPALEFFSYFLSFVAVNMLRTTSSMAYTPRLSIGRLVVARESWRLNGHDLAELAHYRDESRRFLAARRLVRRLGLPEHCFVSISTERKPFYVDFSSPPVLASFASMLRALTTEQWSELRATISEMLPTPGDAWVPGPDGAGYFGELRLQVTDAAFVD